MASISLTTDEAQEIAFGYDGFVTKQFVSEHRWHNRYLVVFERDGDFYGFWYDEPATEMQEGMDAFDSNPVEAFPVVAEEVTTVVYRAG